MIKYWGKKKRETKKMQTCQCQSSYFTNMKFTSRNSGHRCDLPSTVKTLTEPASKSQQGQPGGWSTKLSLNIEQQSLRETLSHEPTGHKRETTIHQVPADIRHPWLQFCSAPEHISKEWKRVWMDKSLTPERPFFSITEYHFNRLFLKTFIWNLERSGLYLLI